MTLIYLLIITLISQIYMFCRMLYLQKIYDRYYTLNAVIKELIKDSNNKFKEKYGFSSIKTEPSIPCDYMGSKTFNITFKKNNKIECIKIDTTTLNDIYSRQDTTIIEEINKLFREK
ncbi:hypothetical protein AK964_01585 [Clostridium butyricum]|nr:hypothetical protein AK964_01585 [Clostridium butyricum]